MNFVVERIKNGRELVWSVQKVSREREREREKMFAVCCVGKCVVDLRKKLGKKKKTDGEERENGNSKKKKYLNRMVKKIKSLM
jgi:hypothetical protein